MFFHNKQQAGGAGVSGLISAKNGGSFADMDTSPHPGKTPDIEDRLARLEALLAERADTLATSPVQRTLKYLPLLAVSNFLIAVPAFLLSFVVAYFTFITPRRQRRCRSRACGRVLPIYRRVRARWERR